MELRIDMSEENKSIFDQVSEFQDIERQLMHGGGEFTPELESRLSVIETTFPAKIDAYRFVMEKLDVGADYWKSKADLYSKIAKSHKTAKERMECAIRESMMRLGVAELVGIDTKFALAPKQAKLEIDKDALDPSYTMTVTKTTQEPDKERIKAALQDGFEVKGASLIPTLKSQVNKKEMKK